MDMTNIMLLVGLTYGFFYMLGHGLKPKERKQFAFVRAAAMLGFVLLINALESPDQFREAAAEALATASRNISPK